MKLLMKDTTKLGIYFLLGIVILVVPLTYTLTTMANNLKNIDTYQIVLSVDKLIQNLGKIDTLNIKINNLTSTLGRINFDELEAALIAIKKSRWYPARQRDKKVGIWLTIPVDFSLTN